MKVVALIMCDDHLYSGGKKTINSLKFFNPEVEVCLYGTKEIERIKKEYDVPDNLWFSAPIVCHDYVKKNGMPDILIKLGADCLIFDYLYEIYLWDYDVACSRNDPDQVGDRDERHNRPDIIRNMPNYEWVNADFVAIKNKKFLDDWLSLTLKYKNGEVYALKDYGKIYKGDDMSSLNVVFRTYGYNAKILDPLGGNIIYGSSGNWCQEGNNWYSWKTIYTFDSGKFMMFHNCGRDGSGRLVRVLHQGGGTQSNKLNYDLFCDSTRRKVRIITGLNE